MFFVAVHTVPAVALAAMSPQGMVQPVSYTHLDVYKRQPEDWPSVKLSYSAEGKWYEIELLQDTATAGFSLIVNGVQQEGLAFELEEALVLEIPEEPKKLTN